jgi:FAD/FMN-containing dehydrogenase
VTTSSVSNFAQGAAPDLATLRSRLDGQLCLPGEPGYEDGRKVANLKYARQPAMIVRAASAADVVQAVRFARRHDLPLAVKSGGHSLAGHSNVDGAMVIDASRMKGISIDAGKRVARVQTGATSGDLAGPAHAYGLALSTGDAASVGLGGLTLGGGIGFMARKYGLAIDNLISVEIVTADGRLIRASEKQHSDLFWALRGGGGNFGIVTEFEFRLAPVGQVYGGVLVLPATKDVIRGYLDYAAAAPDELTTIAHVMHAPPAPFIPEERVGEVMLVIYITHTGRPGEGERDVAPLRALARPIADLVSPIPYPAMYQFTRPLEEPHFALVRSMFADAIPDTAIESILAAVSNSPGPLNIVELRALGGAVGRVAPGETAFAHREAPFMVAVLGLWEDPNEDPAVHERWTVGAWDQLKHLRRGVYVNFVSDEGEARVREAYPSATYTRLAEVKRRYDPDNFFHFNQNIRPA